MAVKKKKVKKKVVRKAPKKKVLKKKVVKKKVVKKQAAGKKLLKENVIGVVTHYFPQVRAAVVKLKGLLVVGDQIKVKGHTTDFTQIVTSMQLDHEPIQSAKKGAEIGLMVKSRVRQNDLVYKV